MIKDFSNFIGKTINQLTILSIWKERDVEHKKNSTLCEAECVCGNRIKIIIARIISNNKKHCGCLSLKAKPEFRLRKSTCTSHGLSTSREYRIWIGIKMRCYRKNDTSYAGYGGRGIKMCDRWLDEKQGFLNFLTDMGNCPTKDSSIDRIDNDGDYEPENCRWATRNQQQRNTRRSKFLTIDGTTKTIADWCEDYHIKYDVFYGRLYRGYTPEEALTTCINGTFLNK